MASASSKWLTKNGNRIVTQRNCWRVHAKLLQRQVRWQWHRKLRCAAKWHSSEWHRRQSKWLSTHLVFLYCGKFQSTIQIEFQLFPFAFQSLGMSTGNLAKKRHLEVPGRDITRTGPIQKMPSAVASSSYMVRSHTKRNLLNQYNDDTISAFAKPSMKSIQAKRLLTSNKKGVSTLLIKSTIFLICLFVYSGLISNYNLTLSRHWRIFQPVKS